MKLITSMTKRQKRDLSKMLFDTGFIMLIGMLIVALAVFVAIFPIIALIIFAVVGGFSILGSYLMDRELNRSDHES